MKTILVLTDFSIKAQSAAEFAMHMALKNHANLLLCHSIELPGIAASTKKNEQPAVADEVRRNEMVFDLLQLSKHLEEQAAFNEKSFIPIVNCVTEFGTIEQTVNRAIKDHEVDLVVIGSHKSHSLTRFIHGSHTHTILDKLKCPVLLIPESFPYRGIHAITYASDLSFDNRRVINYLVDIARPFNALISVNHVSLHENPEADTKTKELKSYLNTYQPTIFYQHLYEFNIKKSLLKLAVSGDTDMLVLVHKHYDFADRLFHTSISKQMANTAKIPLLVLPESFSKTGTAFTAGELVL
jgi:nucleotide-binding universal stress UspA family protein